MHHNTRGPGIVPPPREGGLLGHPPTHPKFPRHPPPRPVGRPLGASLAGAHDFKIPISESVSQTICARDVWALAGTLAFISTLSDTDRTTPCPLSEYISLVGHL